MGKDSFDDELGRLENLMKMAEQTVEFVETPDEPSEPEKKDYAKIILQKAEGGGYVHEAVRDVVYDSLKTVYTDSTKFDQSSTGKEYGAAVNQKKGELYDILENLDTELAGKDVSEVAATFSSLLNIQSQLCLQKTDGVISIRTRLFQFFLSPAQKSTIPSALRQEITLIFSPEELYAMRARTQDMKEDDPLKDFFTSVLDQAYDVVQYNELTGNLLLEMTNYFMNKLQSNGYGNSSKFAEFMERFERAKMSLKKALTELKEIERVVDNHLIERPILMELPRLLRQLIHIKIGLLDTRLIRRILDQIQSCMGEYARARAAVSFDFNRLPSFQHGVRLRQSIILNLQRDVLRYTGQVFEQEFQHVKAEFERMMEDIEASSGELQPGTPEFEEMLKKKSIVQKKLEEQRRKLDVVKSQERMVNVQHAMVGQAIKRYQKDEAIQKKLEEQMQQVKIDDNKTRKVEDPAAAKTPRRVMAKSHH